MSNMIAWIAAEAERPKIEVRCGISAAGAAEGRTAMGTTIAAAEPLNSSSANERTAPEPAELIRSSSGSGRKRIGTGSGGPTGEGRWQCCGATCGTR